MKIDVLSYEDAMLHFVPRVPTVAMRIISSTKNGYLPLEKSPLYLAIFEYQFNDLRPEEVNPNDLGGGKRYILFNRKIARQIIGDFDGVRDRAQGLMVHCYAGVGRSPAVASALNNIFSLGGDSSVWETQKMNEFVYSKLMDVAKTMHVGKFVKRR